jgi:hypothetical protein
MRGRSLVGGLVLLGLARLTHQAAATYTSDQTLWAQADAVSPSARTALNLVGPTLAAGDVAGAQRWAYLGWRRGLERPTSRLTTALAQADLAAIQWTINPEAGRAAASRLLSHYPRWAPAWTLCEQMTCIAPDSPSPSR